jgi:hypothetical protein
VCFTHFPGYLVAAGCFRYIPVCFPLAVRNSGFSGLLDAFSGGVSHCRGVLRIFPGCFPLLGCFTPFPGVLRNPRCYTHFPGVFCSAGCYTHFPGVLCNDGVLYAFCGGVLQRRVLYAFSGGVSHRQGVRRISRGSLISAERFAATVRKECPGCSSRTVCSGRRCTSHPRGASFRGVFCRTGCSNVAVSA